METPLGSPLQVPESRINLSSALLELLRLFDNLRCLTSAKSSQHRLQFSAAISSSSVRIISRSKSIGELWNEMCGTFFKSEYSKVSSPQRLEMFGPKSLRYRYLFIYVCRYSRHTRFSIWEFLVKRRSAVADILKINELSLFVSIGSPLVQGA